MPVLGERAVVLGASMGGMLAARVLADFYRTVAVVERDVLPDNPANRRGVPQGRHTHGLLGRGAQILGELFPGFLDELVAAGATVLGDGDLSKFWVSFGGHQLVRSGTVQDPQSSSVFLQSRPFLEWHVRRRLQAIPNITIHAGHDVVGFASTPDRSRITGARVVDRAGGDERELTADLVIDALGRGAHTPAFLESLGYGRPVEDHVVMHTSYASQLLRIVPGTVEQMVAIAAVPGRPTGMFLLGCEHNTSMFTVYGMVGHEPPHDLAGMLSFARDWAPAHVLAAVRAAEPLGEVARHRMPSSQWRRYDKMRRFPDGLLVAGDAICSFNPIYGQGMSVAALNALALRDCLRGGGDDLPRRYFHAAAKPIGVAWRITVGNDLSFPEVEGPRSPSTRVTNRLVDWVLTACESDAITADRFVRVINFIDPLAHFLRPSYISRVAIVNLRRRRGDSQPRQAVVTGRSDGRAGEGWSK